NEPLRRYSSEFRMVPAHQRLKSVNPRASEFDYRLIKHLKLIAIHRKPQVRLKLQVRNSTGEHLLVKHYVAPVLFLCTMHCHLGISKHILSVSAVCVSDSDAECSACKQLTAINLKRFGQTLQQLFSKGRYTLIVLANVLKQARKSPPADPPDNIILLYKRNETLPNMPDQIVTHRA